MLILIGRCRPLCAQSRLPESKSQRFVASSQTASAVFEQKAAGCNVLGDPRPAVTASLPARTLNEEPIRPLRSLVRDIADQVN